MAAGDATWNPKKGVAYRVTFPILDADGDLVSGATGLDSEVSKDAGTFADCTNEATEIATSSGVYYLDLTATEMNADTVAVIVKTSSSGAKTTVLVMYPLETADMPVDVLAISGDSVAADNLEAAADGTGYNLGGGSIVAASVTAAVTANTTQLAGQTVSAAAGVTFPSTVSSLTAGGVRTELATELGRIDAAVSSRMATFALPTHFADLEIAANGHVSATVQSIANNAITASSIQGGAITAAKFAAGAIDANALAADAVSEVATATLTTAMTESYRAAGAAPTLTQTAFELLAHMGDSAISDLTKTLRKLDGTTAKTFTLDSSTAPTSITEAT